MDIFWLKAYVFGLDPCANQVPHSHRSLHAREVFVLFFFLLEELGNWQLKMIKNADSR